MGAYNIKHLQQQLMGLIKGGESTVYIKVQHLMNGYKGSTTKKEIQNLRSILKRNHDTLDKQLQKLENE